MLAGKSIGNRVVMLVVLERLLIVKFTVLYPEVMDVGKSSLEIFIFGDILFRPPVPKFG